MASAGWDEVLGGGGVGEDPPPPGDHGSGGDDDGAPPPKKRMKTSTKVVLVVGGWLLLTLFLVGQFSSDKPQPSAVARLDTVSGGEGADGSGEDEVFEPEPVDTEEEALLDVDGDGFLSAEELGINEGEASASVEDGGGSGSSGAYEGTAGGSSSSGEGSTGGNAVPGAAPTGGGTATGGGTSTGGGSTSGGTGATSTTTSAGTGGSGGSTTTTSGGSGPTTTTKSTTPASSSTTTSTSTSIASGPEATIAITDPATNIGSPGVFNPGNLIVASGTKVRIHNQDNKAHGWELPNHGEVAVEAGEFSSYVTITGPSGRTIDYRCSVHSSMKGKITIE